MADDKKLDLSGIEDIYKAPEIKEASKAIDLSGIDDIYKPSASPKNKEADNLDPMTKERLRIAKESEGIDDVQVEAAARGGAQGLSANFEPRIVGGLQAIKHKVMDPGTQNLSDLYNKYKQIQEQQNEASKNAYPKTYLGGQFAGGAAQMAIPGLDIAGPGIIATGAKTAALGGLSGLGATEDITANPGQTAVNVAIPAVVGGVLGAGGKALSNLRNAPKASQLANDVKESFEQGRAGQDLTTPDAAKEASKSMLGLGKDIQGSLDSNGNRIGKDIKTAYEGAENNNIDLREPIKDKMAPILDDLHELKANQTDPQRAQDVQKIIDNIMQGVESPETEGTSANVARELRDTLSSRSRLAKSPLAPDTFPALTNQSTGAAQGVGEALNEGVPGLAPANAQYAANASAEELLKTVSPLFERESVQNQQQIAQIIANAEGKGLKSATAEDFIQKIKDYAQESGNPDLVDIIENKAPDIAKRFDLTQKMQKETLGWNPLKLAKPTVLSLANKAGNTPVVGPTIEGVTKAVTSPFQEATTQAVGRVVPGKFIQNMEDQRRNIQTPLKYPDQGSNTNPNETKPLQLSKDLYSANPAQLKDVATSLAQDPTLKSLSASLNQALENNDTMRKNTTLFALLQNPRARQLIYGTNPDEV